MLTRRSLVAQGVKLAASSLAINFMGSTFLQAQGGADKQLRAQTVTGKRSLRAHASAKGLLAGAAVAVKILQTDPLYARILAEQYNIVVAENEMKWKTLRPGPDSFSFEAADALVAFAQKHKMKIRGHNFVWHEAIPDWFSSYVTKENAREVLTHHIMTVGSRYQGKIHSWDVVNEAVLPKDGRPDGLRKSPWMELLGPDYIEIAFRTARQADPHALLTYNEYGVEYDNEEEEERRRVTLQLLRKLKAANVPLDAVGIQSHIKAGSPYAIGKGIRDYMQSVREMGLQIYVTELDVNEDDLPFNDIDRRDHAIADTYRQYLTTVLAEPAVKAVLTWGVSDRHTWLNNGPTHKKKQPDRPQRSLPFDEEYRPKAAFFAIRDCFDQRKA